MPRPKGLPKTGGRQKGSPNKTPTFRAVLEQVFHDDLHGRDWLVAFAKQYPVEFGRMLARTLPLEHTGPDGGPIPVEVHDHFALAAAGE